MRSLLFNGFFLFTTILYAFVCVILSLLPGRKIMMASLRRPLYARHGLGHAGDCRH